MVGLWTKMEALEAGPPPPVCPSPCPEGCKEGGAIRPRMEASPMEKPCKRFGGPLDKLLEAAYDWAKLAGAEARMLNGIARFPRIRRPETLPGIGSGAGRRVIDR